MTSLGYANPSTSAEVAKSTNPDADNKKTSGEKQSVNKDEKSNVKSKTEQQDDKKESPKSEKEEAPDTDSKAATATQNVVSNPFANSVRQNPIFSMVSSFYGGGNSAQTDNDTDNSEAKVSKDDVAGDANSSEKNTNSSTEKNTANAKTLTTKLPGGLPVVVEGSAESAEARIHDLELGEGDAKGREDIRVKYF